jgi:hypothetical protein
MMEAMLAIYLDQLGSIANYPERLRFMPIAFMLDKNGLERGQIPANWMGSRSNEPDQSGLPSIHMRSKKIDLDRSRP